MGMSREIVQREGMKKSVLKQNFFGVPLQMGRKDPVRTSTQWAKKCLRNISIQIATQAK